MTLSNKLAGRITVITGASRGIGFATALALAKAGAHIVAVARSVAGLEELGDCIRACGGNSAMLVPLDLDDFDGIAQLARVLSERYQRLDILVANAGLLGPVAPLADVDPRDFERALRINVTANLQLIRCMDPLLRAAPAGRVVIVSTAAIHTARAERGTYTSSKAALELIGRTYANETAKTPIRVNMINPGATRTRMRAEFMPGEDPTTHPFPDRVAEAIVKLCLPSLDATGRIYDVPAGRLMDFRRPG